MNRSHAILDIESRVKKAKKIELLSSAYGELKYNQMLEVGTGSGVIANYFSSLGYGLDGTCAVDVVDERQIRDGYKFYHVSGVKLPFEEGVFDFVISNHVIEHVGDDELQKMHLNEVYRCLQPGGTFYFAFPNRWRLIEPHYNLPFLSWMPDKLASSYLRVFRKGKYYDCRPLSKSNAVELLTASGFHVQDVTLQAIKLIGEIESDNLMMRVMGNMPKSVYRLLLSIMPTLIFVCRKPRF